MIFTPFSYREQKLSIIPIPPGPTPDNPPYYTDLFRWYDADYPGATSGSSWKDWTLSQDGSVTSNVSYVSGSPSVYDFASSTTGIDLGTSPISGSMNHTVISFTKADTANQNGVISYMGVLTNFQKSVIRFESAGNIRWECQGFGYNAFSYTNDEWYMAGYKLDGTTPNDVVVYKNTSAKAVTGNSTTLNLQTTNFELGNQSALQPLDGKMGIYLLYNRALSTSEIFDVVNHYKYRFYGTPVSESRVLYYDMIETSSYARSGTSINNLDATSLTSTMTDGASYSTNNGGLVVFDGTNDYTTGADNAILDFGTDDFTIEVWFRINGDSNLNGSSQRSAALVTAINKTGTLDGWNLTVRGNSTTTGISIVFEDQVNGTGQYPDYTFPSTLSKNTLYQVGISHSSANGTKFIYNGTNNAASSNLSQAVNGNYALEMGRLGITNYLHYLNGGIAILRIYKGKQLSDAEVLQNYNADKYRM